MFHNNIHILLFSWTFLVGNGLSGMDTDSGEKYIRQCEDGRFEIFHGHALHSKRGMAVSDESSATQADKTPSVGDIDESNTENSESCDCFDGLRNKNYGNGGNKPKVQPDERTEKDKEASDESDESIHQSLSTLGHNQIKGLTISGSADHEFISISYIENSKKFIAKQVRVESKKSSDYESALKRVQGVVQEVKKEHNKNGSREQLFDGSGGSGSSGHPQNVVDRKANEEAVDKLCKNNPLHDEKDKSPLEQVGILLAKTGIKFIGDKGIDALEKRLLRDEFQQRLDRFLQRTEGETDAQHQRKVLLVDGAKLVGDSALRATMSMAVDGVIDSMRSNKQFSSPGKVCSHFGRIASVELTANGVRSNWHRLVAIVPSGRIKDAVQFTGGSDALWRFAKEVAVVFSYRLI